MVCCFCLGLGLSCAAGAFCTLFPLTCCSPMEMDSGGTVPGMSTVVSGYPGLQTLYAVCLNLKEARFLWQINVGILRMSCWKWFLFVFFFFLSRKQFPVTEVAGGCCFIGEMMNRAFPRYGQRPYRGGSMTTKFILRERYLSKKYCLKQAKWEHIGHLVLVCWF